MSLSQTETLIHLFLGGSWRSISIYLLFLFEKVKPEFNFIY
uniref:Uncharacterized protein n=1 Tax=Anguilla anguilla TaxID=7936 RepID=A0A0E9QKD4_ANGAN